MGPYYHYIYRTSERKMIKEEVFFQRNDLLSREELRNKFGILNYVVFVAMLLVSAIIGVFYWWKGQKNTDEFLLASRSMSTLPMTLSLVASFMSAITLLGREHHVIVWNPLVIFGAEQVSIGHTERHGKVWMCYRI